MATLDDLNRELKAQSRAANRRLERAGEGQTQALEHYLRTYHTRQSEQGLRFSQAKARSEAEARQRLEELQKFMDAETSKKRGWQRVKRANLESAGETIRDELDMDITDEELAAILKETGGHSSADFYRALETVAAAKIEEDKEELTAKQIAALLTERRTDQQAAVGLINARRKK